MDQNQQQFQEQYYQQAPVVKNAAYFRTRAREALKGHFWKAVLAVFLAMLLGATMLSGDFLMNFEFEFEINDQDLQLLKNIFSNQGQSGLSDEVIEKLGEISPLFAFGIAYAVLFFVLFALLFFLLGSVITVGYQKFNLNLIDGKPVEIKTVFSYFPVFGKALGLNFMYLLIVALASLPTVLGTVIAMAIAGGAYSFVEAVMTAVYSAVIESSLHHLGQLYLLILPIMIGAVASTVLTVWAQYRYYFSFFILAEYPQIGVIDALRNSATLTKGHKWKLFCLQISFIGWAILVGVIAVFTLGLGALLIFPLVAYQNAAYAAFYDELANRGAAKETKFPSINPDDYDPDQQSSDTSAYAYGGASYTVKEWKFPDDKEEKTEEKTSDAQDVTLKETSEGEETDQ